MRIQRHPLFHGLLLAGVVTSVLSVVYGRLPTEVAHAAWTRVFAGGSGEEPLPPVEASQCVPSISVADLPDSVTKDPRAADYDPVVLQDHGASTESIFTAESRDPEWAPRMERVIVDGVRADLAHGAARARLDQVECRTATCRIRIQSPAPDSGNAWRALQFTVWGYTCSPQGHLTRTEGPNTFMETICYSPRKQRDEYLKPEKIREIRLKKARRMGSVHPLWKEIL